MSNFAGFSGFFPAIPFIPFDDGELEGLVDAYVSEVPCLTQGQENFRADAKKALADTIGASYLVVLADNEAFDTYLGQFAPPEANEYMRQMRVNCLPLVIGLVREQYAEFGQFSEDVIEERTARMRSALGG